MSTIWIDEDKEYDDIGEAFAGAFKKLNFQEALAVWFAMFFIACLALASGLLIGGSTAPQPQPQAVDAPALSNWEPNSVHAILAASLDRETVKRFCAKRGFGGGYPAVDGRYKVHCYGDKNGMSVNKAYGMFDEFAAFVGVDETPGDAK